MDAGSAGRGIIDDVVVWFGGGGEERWIGFYAQAGSGSLVGCFCSSWLGERGFDGCREDGWTGEGDEIEGARAYGAVHWERVSSTKLD